MSDYQNADIIERLDTIIDLLREQMGKPPLLKFDKSNNLTLYTSGTVIYRSREDMPQGTPTEEPAACP